MKGLSAFDPDLGLMILSEDTLSMSDSRYVFTCNLLCFPATWFHVIAGLGSVSPFGNRKETNSENGNYLVTNGWSQASYLTQLLLGQMYTHNGIFLLWLSWGSNEKRYVKCLGELERDYLRLILRSSPLKTNYLVPSHIKHNPEHYWGYRGFMFFIFSFLLVRIMPDIKSAIII